MVKEALTNEMILDGADLTGHLDSLKLTVHASLWFYLSELNSWRLLIVSPEVKKSGPKAVYKKVQKALKNMGDTSISLSDIEVLETTHSIISILSIMINTNMDISGIRFSKNTINGHFIEDAYVYRLFKAKTKRKKTTSQQRISS